MPLRLEHVAPKDEDKDDSTTSDLWTDNDILQQEVTYEHLEQHLPSLTEAFLSRVAEGHLLFFWTWSATFNITFKDAYQPSPSLFEYVSQHRPTIHDQNGDDVGFVCKPGAPGAAYGPQAFVAIGRRQVIGLPEELAEEVCPPVILALQIERDQYGISSRVNLGEISLKAWTRAEPKKVLVVLQ